MAKSVFDTRRKEITSKKDIQEYILRLHESERGKIDQEACMSMVKNANIPLAIELWNSWARGEEMFSDFAEVLKIMKH